jgi:hypothetical protein
LQPFIAVNPEVTGSTPVRPLIFCFCSLVCLDALENAA